MWDLVREVSWDGWDGLVRILIVAPVGYLALIVYLRLAGKRSLAKLNAFDFVITIALGSTLATMILSERTSVAEGALALGVLVALQFLVSLATSRSHRLRRTVSNAPTRLAEGGSMLRDAMRESRVAPEDLEQAARKHGARRVEDVDAIILETDGSISVLGTREDPRGTGSEAGTRDRPH